MEVKTDSERVRHSRKLVLELLASSVDLSIDAERRRRTSSGTRPQPERYGPPAPPDPRPRPQAHRPSRRAGRPDGGDGPRAGRRSTTSSTSATTRSASSATSASTPAASSTRTRSRSPSPAAGFDARISTEYVVELPESACVYCGNCIAVCPTGALMFKSEHDMRAGGHLGRVEPDRDRHDLPLLRRRLQPDAARAGQRDRQGHLARRPRHHARQPLHQGPLRLPARPGATAS